MNNPKNNIETLKIVLNENLPKSTMIDTNKILSFGNHKNY